MHKTIETFDEVTTEVVMNTLTDAGYMSHTLEESDGVCPDLITFDTAEEGIEALVNDLMGYDQL